MHVLNSFLNRLRPVVPIVLRAVLGVTMFWHGYQKFHAGLSGTKDFFKFLSIPLPGVAAAVVALLEVIGGIAIVLGVTTRLISLLFIVELLVALLRYKYGESVGFIGAKEAGAELDWALLAGFVALAATGPGTLSVDHTLKLDRTWAESKAIAPAGSSQPS